MTAEHGVPLALVHHANQYLIVDDYDNRQGLSSIVRGYHAVLRLHERFGVPANLHLSGVLLETVAWHCPWFLDVVRELRDKGIVSLLGGTYSENVMPMFDAVYNRRQLVEHTWLLEEHLGCAPSDLQVAWIPERVWSTEKLSPVLGSADLPNGGFRGVLLDDRLLYPTNGVYHQSPRRMFDAHGPYGAPGDAYWSRVAAPPSPAEVCRAYRIAGSDGIGVIPISANLRYWVPPASDEQWRCLDETLERMAGAMDPATILTYADDLERTAGVGGWDALALERYERFLEWVVWRRDRGELEPVHVGPWLADRAVGLATREVQDGTFYEVAQGGSAGEDYQGWWDAPQWAPARRALEDARDVVEAAASAASHPDLLELAWKHLLASGYETAWHEPQAHGIAPCPWAIAVASHARAARVIAAAARWAAADDRPAFAGEIDVDADGDLEVVLSNDSLYAVLSPHQGGRLIYLFARYDSGAHLLVGNPTDDWNFQAEQNRFMDWPPNHPGGLVDYGFEHDRWRVVLVRHDAGGALIELLNVQRGSRLSGARKRVSLACGETMLATCYSVPNELAGVPIGVCLSPDYYTLLRRGRAAVERIDGSCWTGARCGTATAWLGLVEGESTMLMKPERPEAGHGLNVGALLAGEHTHVVLGTAPVPAEALHARIRLALAAAHGGELEITRPSAEQVADHA